MGEAWQGDRRHSCRCTQSSGRRHFWSKAQPRQRACRTGRHGALATVSASQAKVSKMPRHTISAPRGKVDGEAAPSNMPKRPLQLLKTAYNGRVPVVQWMHAWHSGPFCVRYTAIRVRDARSKESPHGTRRIKLEIVDRYEIR